MALRRLRMTFFRLMASAPLAMANGDNHGQHLRGQAYATAIAKKNVPFPIVLGKPLMRKPGATMTAIS